MQVHFDSRHQIQNESEELRDFVDFDTLLNSYPSIFDNSRLV